MSMSSKVESDLWPLLNYGCGLEQGRAAINVDTGMIFSSYQVMSKDKKKPHQVKLIMTGSEFRLAAGAEEIVTAVTERRQSQNKFEYNATFITGAHHFLSAKEFIDLTGEINEAWLSFCDKEDLLAAFKSYTKSQLRVCIMPNKASLIGILGNVRSAAGESDWGKARSR